MADLEFQDFGIDPDEAVKSRKAALDQFTNVAQPAFETQAAAQRGQLASDVYKQAAGAAATGQPGTLMQEALGKAAQQSAELLPKQAAEKDVLAQQGAQMQQDVMVSKQTAALAKFVRNTEESKAESARYLADKAFEMGMSAQELALHQNGYLADYGIRRLYEDYQSGRATQQDVLKYQRATTLEATRLENEMKQQAATLQGQLQEALAAKNLKLAQERFDKLFKMYEDTMKAKARAAQIGGIISGVTTLGGMAVGAYFGGPGGAILGGSIGSQVGGMIPTEGM